MSIYTYFQFVKPFVAQWKERAALFSFITCYNLVAHWEETTDLSLARYLETVLTLLLNDLAGLKENGLLLLDDYHVITFSHIHETLIFFLEHLPPTLSLIVLTRHEPPLPLMRWRARGELSEIHTATLRFSPEETALFLRQILPIALSDKICKRVDTTLEGWSAGLRLLGLAQPP